MWFEKGWFAVTSWDLALYLGANLLVYYTYSRFHRTLLGSARAGALPMGAAYLVAFGINSGWTLLGWGQPWQTLLLSIGLLAGLSLLYRKPLRVRILVTLLLYVLVMLLEVVAYYLNQYSKTPISQVSVIVLFTALIFFFVQLVFERLWGKTSGQPLSMSHWLAVFLLPLGSIAIILSAMRGGFAPESIVVTALLQLGSNVLIFRVYHALGRQYQVEYERRMLEQQNRALAGQFEIIRQSMESLRALDHDMQNHLDALDALLEQGSYSEAASYLRGLIQRSGTGPLLVSTGHSELDCILSFKLARADELKVRSNVQVSIPRGELAWELFDLNVILGNLLDNALEALELCTERRLDISVKLSRGTLFIEVGNSYDGTIRTEEESGAPRLLTRKKDAAHHGIGLRSVESVVEKYQGSMRVEPSERYFRAFITLPRP